MFVSHRQLIQQTKQTTSPCPTFANKLAVAPSATTTTPHGYGIHHKSFVATLIWSLSEFGRTLQRKIFLSFPLHPSCMSIEETIPFVMFDAVPKLVTPRFISSAVIIVFVVGSQQATLPSRTLFTMTYTNPFTQQQIEVGILAVPTSHSASTRRGICEVAAQS